ncbi:deoxynucleoside kinase [bacterium]|nr:deoxynucleoside kinase [bacterium]
MDDSVRFLAIEGVIGVGKTTLAEMLGETFSARLVLEEFEENPFLEDFYKNPGAWALHTQLFFLLSRFHQMKNLGSPELFDRLVVSDYIFQKNRIYANINLSDPELRLFNEIADVLEVGIPAPDLVVYLEASVEVLLDRIRKRGRSYEKRIDPDYIRRLAEAYNHFFFNFDDCPLLIVNTNFVDFSTDTEEFARLLRILDEPAVGVRYYNPRRELF